MAITTDQFVRHRSILSLSARPRSMRRRYSCISSPAIAVLGGKLMSPHALEIAFVFDNVATDRLSGDASTEIRARGKNESGMACIRAQRKYE